MCDRAPIQGHHCSEPGISRSPILGVRKEFFPSTGGLCFAFLWFTLYYAVNLKLSWMGKLAKIY